MKAALTGCLHKIELWEDSDVLEVGVFEKSGVFEAVAEETVEGDVGDPDEGDGCQELVMRGERDESEGDREEKSVGQVVRG